MPRNKPPQAEEETPPGSQAFCTHQRELVSLQLPGPEGFGAVTFHQGLLAADLVLRLPGGETLQAEESKTNAVRPVSGRDLQR